MKKILIINFGWEQELLLKKLAEKDVELFGIHYDENYIKSVDFQGIKICDLRDLESIVKFADSIKPDAVISDNCDYSLFAQALIGKRLNLPSPSVEAAQVANNKLLQRDIARASNFEIPKYKLCLSQEDVANFAKKNGFPIIVKPTDNRGSFGVRKVSSKEELKKAYENALINSNSRLVLAEDFIDGVQITIDGYSFKSHGNRSLAIGDKELIGEDGEVATTISYPSTLPTKIVKKALKTNEKINKAFGYKFGMTHSEYMIKDEKIYLIESTNRGGGVFTSSIITPKSSGIDLLEQYISDILGEAKDLYKKSKHLPITLKFFRFPPNGEVEKLEGYEKIKSDKRVITSMLNIKKGDKILPITNDANRHGFIIFQGDKKEAEKLCENIRITFK